MQDGPLGFQASPSGHRCIGTPRRVLGRFQPRSRRAISTLSSTGQARDSRQPDQGWIVSMQYREQNRTPHREQWKLSTACRSQLAHCGSVASWQRKHQAGSWPCGHGSTASGDFDFRFGISVTLQFIVCCRRGRRRRDPIRSAFIALIPSAAIRWSLNNGQGAALAAHKFRICLCCRRGRRRVPGW